jgi:hypothetical protein
MLYGLISAAISAASGRGGQISDRQPRQRRRDPEAPPEASNPDFDFGPTPSTAELARPSTAERRLSSLMLVIGLLMLVPLAIILLAFIVP